MAESSRFSWVQTHKELVHYLLKMRDSQGELVSILKKAGIGGLTDKDAQGSIIELQEIDPFSFFFYIYKYGDAKRLEYLRKIAMDLSLTLPSDLEGIPTTYNLIVRLFADKAIRQPPDIGLLWDLFEKALEHRLSQQDFIEILQTEGLGMQKLSEALYFVDPEYYICLNPHTTPYLTNELQIKQGCTNYDDYKEILDTIKAKTSSPLYSLVSTAMKYLAEDSNSMPSYHLSTENSNLKEKSMDQITDNLNQILYGPPGTGKTYNAIELAVRIADPDFGTSMNNGNPNRRKITERYQELVKEGRIVFTTFHQSMGYEDFIEGIKPLKPDKSGLVKYDIVDGIFKELCKKTYEEYLGKFVSLSKDSFPNDNINFSVSEQVFSRLFDAYLETIPDESKTERSNVILQAVRGNPLEVYRSENRSMIIVRSGLQRTPRAISKRELIQVYQNRKQANILTHEKILINEILKLNNKDTNSHVERSFDQSYSRLCSDLKSMSESCMKIMTPNGTMFGISLNSKNNLTVHTAPEFKGGVTLTKENLLSYAEGKDVPPYDKGYFLGVLRFLITNYGLEDVSKNRNRVDNIDQDDFDILYSILVEEIRSKLTAHESYILPTKLNRPREVIKIMQDNSLIVSSPKNRTYQVDVQQLRRLFYSGSDVKSIPGKDIHKITGKPHSSAYWAVWDKILQIQKNLRTASPVGNTSQPRISSVGPKEESTEKYFPVPYVLIIDEINRGNVSQIFGELITLIEPDKRTGMPEALEVTLPYSKEKFSVPPNLHIIGTMNTADRSVEALDAALRRRFTFKEYLPKTEILDENGEDLLAVERCGFSLKDIIEKLNLRIRMLLDRDHQIGHSCFLGLADDAALLEVFNCKIIPLLQEYFYGDYAKIGLVLGDGFVQKEKLDISTLADFDYDDVDSMLRESYQIVLHKDLNEFKLAIKKMLNK